METVRQNFIILSNLQFIDLCPNGLASVSGARLLSVY